MKVFKIGELAKAVSVNVETIRYYQRFGFLKKPIKPSVGYRKYTQDDALRILFIKEVQNLGFSLKQTKEMLSLRVNAKSCCKDVLELAKAKISEIETKQRSLSQMKNALLLISKACKTAGATAACPILDSLTITIRHKMDSRNEPKAK